MAETGPSRGAQQPSGPAAADVTQAAAHPAAGAAPDDVQQLRAQIEETREQLGETVEQLAAKADLESRARAKAAELSGRVKNKASHAVKAAPEPLRQAVAKGTSTARRRRVPLAVAAGVIMVGCLVIRRWGRR